MRTIKFFILPTLVLLVAIAVFWLSFQIKPQDIGNSFRLAFVASVFGFCPSVLLYLDAWLKVMQEQLTLR